MSQKLQFLLGLIRCFCFGYFQQYCGVLEISSYRSHHTHSHLQQLPGYADPQRPLWWEDWLEDEESFVQECNSHAASSKYYWFIFPFVSKHEVLHNLNNPGQFLGHRDLQHPLWTLMSLAVSITDFSQSPFFNTCGGLLGFGSPCMWVLSRCYYLSTILLSLLRS